MVMKIDRDQRRFRQIVRGRIRENLRKYMTHGEMIGRKGRDLVSIPVPQLDVPHFRYGDNGSGGVGQGDGEDGQPIAKGGDAAGRPGPGRQRSRRRHICWKSISRWKNWPRSSATSWSCPASSRKGKANDRPGKVEVQQHPPDRPRIAAALQADVSRRPCGGRLSTGVYEPDDPRVIPIKADKQYRSWNTIAAPAGQRGRHLHDGRLRLDDRRAEGDRPHRGVLDRHLARAASTTASKRATSSTTPWPRKSTSTRSITPAKAAARGSARPTKSCRGSDRRRISPVRVEHLLLPVFRRRQLGRGQRAKRSRCWANDCCRSCNLFCYGQVESPYGSGEFIRALQEPLRRRARNAGALGD